jgi:hypothetical protein
MNLFMCLHKEANSCPKLCNNFFFFLTTLKPYSTISNSKQLPHFILYLLSFVKLGFDLWNLVLHKKWKKGICFTKCQILSLKLKQNSVWEVDIFQDLLKDSLSKIMFSYCFFFHHFFLFFFIENYARTKYWVAYLFRMPWKCFNIPRK